ncbi:uncharacterized protein PAN0_160d6822, partial [Moesziomyces antarcticus]
MAWSATGLWMGIHRKWRKETFACGAPQLRPIGQFHPAQPSRQSNPFAAASCWGYNEDGSLLPFRRNWFGAKLRLAVDHLSPAPPSANKIQPAACVMLCPAQPMPNARPSIEEGILQQLVGDSNRKAYMNAAHKGLDICGHRTLKAPHPVRSA